MADDAISAPFDGAQERAFSKTMVCLDCGAECERRGGKQKYCPPCRDTHKRRKIGSIIQCGGCGSDIVLDVGSRKLCDDCAAASKAVSTKASRLRNADKNRDRNRVWHDEHREELLEKARQKRVENPDAIREKEREYYAKNRERKREIARASCQRRRVKRAEYSSRPEVLARDAELKAKQRKSDHGKRVHWNMSRHIRMSIKDKGKRSWQSVVGYTREELMAHLEERFLPGMTWDNYGKHGWHIDHETPRAAFRFSSSNDLEFKACWELKNLRPLWSHDNLTKSDKLEGAPLGLARFIHKSPPQSAIAQT